MNPAHPKQTTPYGKAMAIARQWAHHADMRLASPEVMRAAEAGLRACGVTHDKDCVLPGKALLGQLQAEQQRRAANAATRASVEVLLRRNTMPEGAYSRVLWQLRQSPIRFYTYA